MGVVGGGERYDRQLSDPRNLRTQAIKQFGQSQCQLGLDEQCFWPARRERDGQGVAFMKHLQVQTLGMERAHHQRAGRAFGQQRVNRKAHVFPVCRADCGDCLEHALRLPAEKFTRRRVRRAFNHAQARPVLSQLLHRQHHVIKATVARVVLDDHQPAFDLARQIDIPRRQSKQSAQGHEPVTGPFKKALLWGNRRQHE